MLPRSFRGRRPTAPNPRRESQRGQLLVLFALAMVALIAMIGLIIDGGDTSFQKRDQQNVADAAAMAAGYALLQGQDVTAAAQSVAAANGYTNGQGGTTVTVSNLPDRITVDVSRPHRNYFSGIFGFASWGVTATASVEAGYPNMAAGTMPIIFNEAMFTPANLPTYTDPNRPFSFNEPGSGSQDVPQEANLFNWTNFCIAGGSGCNADSTTVNAWINADGIQQEVATDWVIAPLNAGAHTTLFDSMANVVGTEFPVAIVNDAGTLQGWACFNLTGSVGGSTKSLIGWFEFGCDPPNTGIIQGIASGGIFGAYVVQLIN